MDKSKKPSSKKVVLQKRKSIDHHKNRIYHKRAASALPTTFKPQIFNATAATNSKANIAVSGNVKRPRGRPPAANKQRDTNNAV